MRHRGVKGFSRVMAKAFEYKDEKGLQGFEKQVLSPFYVIDVLRCMFVVQTAERLLKIREALIQQVPNARTKNGYNTAANAPRGYRDMKLNPLFSCGEYGKVFTEVQLVLAENEEAKKKSHFLYEVIRGDFSQGDIDAQALTPSMTRLGMAQALIPNMRALQQEAAREMHSGMMTTALLLSYVDLGTTVSVGFQYLWVGGTGDAYTTFGLLAFSLITQAVSTFSTGQGVLATVITLCGGKTMYDTYNVMWDRDAEGSMNPVRALAFTRMYEVRSTIEKPVITIF